MNADALLEELGRQRVDHGKQVQGLSMADVWAYAAEVALSASRQRPSDSGTQSQNLLRGYCRARVALEELQAMAVKYQVAPQLQKRRIAGAPIQLDLEDQSEQQVALSLSKTALSVTSSRPAVIAGRVSRTTKGGRCLPLEIVTLPTQPRQRQAGDKIPFSLPAWICADLTDRIQAAIC